MTAPANTSRRALIVEDEPSIREIVRLHLSLAGFEPEEVADGRAALDRLLVPSVRWFIRRRVNRVLDELGARLDVKIPEFTLTKRQVLIDRLVHDRALQAAAAQYAAENKMPGAVATESSDAIFAPIQALWLVAAYKGWRSLPVAIFGGLEELAPGTDVIPTCTLYHIYAMREKYGEAPNGALPAAR